MTPPQAQPASIQRPPAGNATTGAASAAEGPFVINLRSSTTPMALSQPNDPALARFKFFMSRRLEDGRERFRLHMGFFETLAEAEEWLGAVREIYPGAWAGDAPGKRLKARTQETTSSASAVAAPPAQLPPAAAAPARATPIARATDMQAVRREAAAPAGAGEQSRQVRAAAPRTAPEPDKPAIPRNVPVLQPASSVAPRAVATAAAGSKSSTSPARSPAGETPRPITAAARQSTARQSRPAAPQPQGALTPSAPAASKAAAAGSKQKSAAARLPLSNVREVLAALDETGATRQMPALGVASPAPAPTSPVVAHAEPEQNLSDTQVLKLLESRRADGAAAEVDGGISLLKPEDTGTRRAIKEAIATNAPVSFAVQLQWSVQAIDISKVPPLAIFSAYTLYTVEGSREGRRWYGLRLGFFSDAISAKQVAHYVRSEFNSVAVVPVSPQERGRATEGNRDPVQGPKPARAPVRDRLPEATAEFKLIDDAAAHLSVPAAPASSAASAPSVAPDPAASASGSKGKPASAPAAAKPKAAAARPPAKRGPRTPAGRVKAHDRRSPQTLEETLEILGADQLEIDQGRGERLNDTGVRHIKVEVRKNSPFTRLLDRLSERARGR